MLISTWQIIETQNQFDENLCWKIINTSNLYRLNFIKKDYHLIHSKFLYRFTFVEDPDESISSSLLVTLQYLSLNIRIIDFLSIIYIRYLNLLLIPEWIAESYGFHIPFSRTSEQTEEACGIFHHYLGNFLNLPPDRNYTLKIGHFFVEVKWKTVIFKFHMSSCSKIFVTTCEWKILHHCLFQLFPEQRYRKPG